MPPRVAPWFVGQARSQPIEELAELPGHRGGTPAGDVLAVVSDPQVELILQRRLVDDADVPVPLEGIDDLGILGDCTIEATFENTGGEIGVPCYTSDAELGQRTRIVPPLGDRGDETISQAKAAADKKRVRRTVTAMHSSERSGFQKTGPEVRQRS